MDQRDIISKSIKPEVFMTKDFTNFIFHPISSINICFPFTQEKSKKILFNFCWIIYSLF